MANKRPSLDNWNDVKEYARQLGVQSISTRDYAFYHAVGMMPYESNIHIGQPTVPQMTRGENGKYWLAYHRLQFVISDKEIEATRRKWESIILDTTPVDRDRATESVQALYRTHGLNDPHVWFIDNYQMNPHEVANSRASNLLSLAAHSPDTPLFSTPFSLPFSGRTRRFGRADSFNRVVGNPESIDTASAFKFVLWDMLRDHDVAIPETVAAILDVIMTCGSMIPMETTALIIGRPSAINFDKDNRLHCATGGAIVYPTWSHYYWHGNKVAQWIVEKPERITIDHITKERNAEVRRILTERFGAERYLNESGMKLVKSDKFGDLYIKLDTSTGLRTDVTVILRVTNSTAEPDGTYRQFSMFIDPNAYNRDTQREPQAASASLWRYKDGSLAFRDWREYSPDAES